MDLLERVLNCKTDAEVDKLITEALTRANASSIPIEQLGFSQNRKMISNFKGFIPLKTRIKYDINAIETYGMETTDYFYEFAHIVRRYGIRNKSSLIHNLEKFIILYFGLTKSNRSTRDQVFYGKALNSTQTDEEFFEALNKNKIGDLKQTGAAECTEVGALVQEILTLFGFESYYCIGCLDRGNKQEAHCFNIVKRKNDYALLDYSIPVPSYAEDGRLLAMYPFIGTLSTAEFLDFLDRGSLKSFENYEYSDSQKVTYPSLRTYVVGSFEITQDIPASSPRGLK